MHKKILLLQVFYLIFLIKLLNSLGLSKIYIVIILAHIVIAIWKAI